MKLVLASKNVHELVEMGDILSQLGVEVVLESEVGVDADVEETGATFEEGAFLKTRAVMEASGLPAIADDSGLCVDVLNGAPGVYSACYGGPGLDDVGRYRLLLENMRGQLDRRCRFVSAICYCFPNGDRMEVRGECPGTSAYAPKGEDDSGYDPIFFVSALKKTFAGLSPAEKNTISHRGNVLTTFREKLEQYLNKQNAFPQEGRSKGDRSMEELTSRQRAQLRGLANSIDTILHVGKDGIGDNLVKQAGDTLEARELIKGKVLENSLLSSQEAAEALAGAARSQVVQVIGTKSVLYRPAHKKDKEDKVVLVTDKKRK